MIDGQPDIFERYAKLEAKLERYVDNADFWKDLANNAGLKLRDLKQQLEDMTVQAAFWRQCADNAVDGWIAQEDVSITLREKLVEACDIGWYDRTKQTLAMFHAGRERLAALKAEALADDAPEET